MRFWRLLIIATAFVAGGIACNTIRALSGGLGPAESGSGPEAGATVEGELEFNLFEGSEQNIFTREPDETVESVATPAEIEVTGHGMSFIVTDVIRPADELVAAGNAFNATPVPGYEYVLVGFQATCQEPSGETCHLWWVEFRLRGDAGSEYNPKGGIAGFEGLLNEEDLPPGESVSVALPFVVEQGDTNLTLIHRPRSGAEDLAIPATRSN